MLSDGSGEASASTPTASASTTTSSEASATPSASPSEDSNAEAVAAARTACVAQVKAAEGVAAAAKNSALHWKQHTDAFLDKNSGKISAAETKKRYAASKAFGLADEKAMASSTKALQATGAACADAAKEAAEDATVKACTTRLAALDKVRTTGTTVQNEWSAHMRMMANKAHTEFGAYHDKWLDAVKAAQKSVPAYNAAAEGVSKAPACA